MCNLMNIHDEIFAIAKRFHAVQNLELWNRISCHMYSIAKQLLMSYPSFWQSAHANSERKKNTYSVAYLFDRLCTGTYVHMQHIGQWHTKVFIKKAALIEILSGMAPACKHSHKKDADPGGALIVARQRHRPQAPVITSIHVISNLLTSICM